MPDVDVRELPNILGVKVQPWINLIHMVGLPWVIIVVSIIYGIPYARDISQSAKDVSTASTAVQESSAKTNERLRSLEAQAADAMPLLKESVKAIPLLERIHAATKEGAKQRHMDLDELKVEAAKKE